MFAWMSWSQHGITKGIEHYGSMMKAERRISEDFDMACMKLKYHVQHSDYFAAAEDDIIYPHS